MRCSEFAIFVTVHMYVCVYSSRIAWFNELFFYILHAYVCVSVCVQVNYVVEIAMFDNPYGYIFIQMYVYICVCVCQVYVCERDRVEKREKIVEITTCDHVHVYVRASIL